MPDRALLAAARFERDRRAASYPQRIFEGRISAEDAAVDYQCWVAIAEWFETERFFSFAGGAEPDRDDAPVISWPQLEDAAKKALHQVERKLAAEGWLDGCPPTATSERRNALVRIHRAIQLRGESIETINRELRADQEIAA
jgi:hypothetical protein